MLTVIPQILWPLVTLGIAALSCYSFWRWLQRETATVAALKRELAETTRDWTHKFERSEQAFEERLRAIERRLNAQGPNPLGSHYDTRRPG